MGHKVNPAIFRIGISVDWKYQLRDPLLANIFIYKLIKNFFGTPLFSALHFIYGKKKYNRARFNCSSRSKAVT